MQSKQGPTPCFTDMPDGPDKVSPMTLDGGAQTTWRSATYWEVTNAPRVMTGDLPVQCGQNLAPVTAFFCGVHRGSRRKSNGFADFNFIQLQEAVVILGEHHSSQSCALFP